jgi:hypothetical protein
MTAQTDRNEGTMEPYYTIRETRKGDWIVFDGRGENFPQTRGAQAHAQAEADKMNAAFCAESQRREQAAEAERARLAERPDLTRRWAEISATRREWYGLLRHREAEAGSCERALMRGMAHLAAQTETAIEDCEKMRSVYSTLEDTHHRIAVACRAGQWGEAEREIESAEAYVSRWAWSCYHVQEVAQNQRRSVSLNDQPPKAAEAELARLAERPDLTLRWVTLSTTLREWYRLLRHREVYAGRVEMAAIMTDKVHMDGRPHSLDLVAQAAGARKDCAKMRVVYRPLSDMHERIAVACRAGQWGEAEREIVRAEEYAAQWEWSCYHVQEVAQNPRRAVSQHDQSEVPAFLPV